MAEADFTAAGFATDTRESPSQTEMRIVTARGGSRVFPDLNEVRAFSRATAEDLAALTVIMTDANADSPFSEQMWGLANDLAFQLQQSVALMCKSEST